MRTGLARYLPLVLLLFLAACGDATERDEALLMWAASANQVGSAKDYVLRKPSTFSGSDANLALFFGVIDDREFCSEVAEMYNRRYTAANLYCEPVD